MGEYMRDLRRLVGSIPLLQCGASVIVENQAGETLLRNPGQCMEWAYEGGAVELYGGRVEDACARNCWRNGPWPG